MIKNPTSFPVYLQNGLIHLSYGTEEAVYLSIGCISSEREVYKYLLRSIPMTIVGRQQVLLWRGKLSINSDVEWLS